MAISNFPLNTSFVSPDFEQKAEHFVHPHECDVLSGRGGFVNAHPGNVRFRELVHSRKTEYSLETNKERKMEICREVIALVHNSGGQFLAKDTGSSLWKTMSDDRVVAKTNQALREGAPKIREAFQEKAKRTYRGKRSFHSSPLTSVHQSSPVQPTVQEPQQLFLPIFERSPSLGLPSNESTNMLNMPQQEGGERSTTVSPSFDSLSGDDGYCSGDSVRQLFDLVATPTIPPLGAPIKIPNEFEELEQIQAEQAIRKKHSLILSDISPSPNYLREEFQNPFANESWFLDSNSNDAGMTSLMDTTYSFPQRGVSSTLPTEFSV